MIKSAFREATGERELNGGTLREAAYRLAVSRVVEATADRGIFP